MFKAMLKRLHLELKQNGHIGLGTWMVDSTFIRTTPTASVVPSWDAVVGADKQALSICVTHGIPLGFAVSLGSYLYWKSLAYPLRQADRSNGAAGSGG